MKMKKHFCLTWAGALPILLVLFASLAGCCGKSSEISSPVKSSETTESETIEQTKPKQPGGPKVTFIELGSVRCIPCIAMQEVMKEIEQEYGEQVRIVFYDVWTPQGEPFARQYGIRVIPTQVFLDNTGQEFFRHEGYFPKEELVEVMRRQGAR